MKTAWILSGVAALSLLVAAGPAPAEEGWLGKLNPLAKKQTHSTLSSRKNNAKKAGSSPLDKLASGTKKVFADTRDALTFKKPAPKQKATSQYAPWNRTSQVPRPVSNQKKKSWLDSLLGREKPKQVESMKDWVGLPRLEP
jgi:hypothetical protein